MIIDYFLVKNIKLDKYEVVVIGAGTSGINVVNQLLKKRSKTKICLIESGGFTKDKIINSLDTDKSKKNKINFSRSVARFFGGKSNLWDGRIVPLDEDELKSWPINYQELIFWIDKSLNTLGIQNNSIINLLKNTKDLFKNSSLGKLMDKEFDIAPAFFAKNIKRFNLSSLEQYAPQTSSTFDILIHANAMKFHLDKNNNCISSLELRDSFNNSQRIFKIKSKYYVLACGGLETPKILLNSPHNIANSSKLLGLNFSGHPRGIQGIIKLKKNFSIKSLLFANPKNINFPVKNEIGLKLKNNFKTSNISKSRIVITPLDFAYHNKFYYALKPKMTYMKSYLIKYDILPFGYFKGFFYLLFAKIADKFNYDRKTKFLFIRNYAAASLNKKSKIYIPKKKKEEKSLKTELSIDWQIKKEDKENLALTHKILNNLLIEYSIGYLEDKVESQKWNIWGGSSHFMSTTVMSDNPDEGVVDKNCRSHDHKNLFIVGPSVFPTPSYANPMLMIVALSMRLGDKIAEIISKEK